MYKAKTKPLISCTVTNIILMCAFVFAYGKTGFLRTQLIYCDYIVGEGVEW